MNTVTFSASSFGRSVLSDCPSLVARSRCPVQGEGLGSVRREYSMSWQIRRAAGPAPDPLAAEVPLVRAGLGLPGVWRLIHLLLVWVLFAGRVWLHRRRWFGRSLEPL